MVAAGGVVLCGGFGPLADFITGLITVEIFSSSKTTGCGLGVGLCGLEVGLGRGLVVGLGLG